MMTSFRNLIGLTVAAASLVFTTQANAAVACPFTISSVSIDWGGNVNVAVSNNGNPYIWYICNVQGTVSINAGPGPANITSGACNALFAQMLTARAAGQPIVLSFQNLSACTPAQLPTSWTWMGTNYPLNFSF
jgi:hypothetical protein